MWNEEATKLKLCSALAWHQVMLPAKVLSGPPQASKQQSVINKVQREVGPFSEAAQPEDKACAAFNRGTCVTNASHGSDLHVCSYCLYTIQRLCHTDAEGIEAFKKNAAGGSVPDHPKL